MATTKKPCVLARRLRSYLNNRGLRSKSCCECLINVLPSYQAHTATSYSQDYQFYPRALEDLQEREAYAFKVSIQMDIDVMSHITQGCLLCCYSVLTDMKSRFGNLKMRMKHQRCSRLNVQLNRPSLITVGLLVLLLTYNSLTVFRMSSRTINRGRSCY
jgi:hypothetical protein